MGNNLFLTMMFSVFNHLKTDEGQNILSLILSTNLTLEKKTPQLLFNTSQMLSNGFRNVYSGWTD